MKGLFKDQSERVGGNTSNYNNYGGVSQGSALRNKSPDKSDAPQDEP